ncbi:MAG: T9SS type A sorting domain-containing protein, partial [Ginsengibacter sp.]
YKINGTCGNTGWKCLSRNSSSPAGIGAIFANAGEVILLLANAEKTVAVSQSFQINCATNVCSSIIDISCGNAVQFNSLGFGDPNYPNNLNGQGCTNGTGQGGQETIYRLVAPATGTYQINATADNNTYVDYYYKINGTCGNTGWKCLSRNNNSPVGIGAIYANAGEVILLLANAEPTGTVSQSFKINCATNVCNAITDISCGNTIQFNSLGFGDPNYPSDMNGQGCTNTTAQGGQETIYRLVAPATGTYQINATADNNTYVDYYYKINGTCGNTGWKCLSRNNNSPAGIGAIFANAGEVILLLANAEPTGTVSQSFQINCATNVCSSIIDISVGNTIQFNSLGFGDPNYPNNMNGQGCTNTTGQGGQETIYRLVAPTSGTYQINATADNNTYVDYYYKINATCGNTGWACLSRNNNSPASVGMFNANSNDVILLLLNAEPTGTVSQSFIINASPLPLKLLSFNVTNEGMANRLSWTTEAEINTDYFMVEQSNNGTEFSDLAKVKTSNNNGLGIKNYEYSDHFDQTGQNFYRLKMVDIDGAFTYSKTVAVTNKFKRGIQVYPNPSKDILHAKIMYDKPKDAVIKVTDLTGRVIQTHSVHLVNGISNMDLDVSTLPAGVYLIKLNEDNIYIKFLKE